MRVALSLAFAIVLLLPSVLATQEPPSEEASATLDLEADPVYRRHPDDWRTYHTRFVTPRIFLDGLWAK